MDSQQVVVKSRMRLKRRIQAKTREQINALEDVYSENRSPSDSLMEELVLRTGITMEEIVAWFENKRSKAQHGVLIEEVRRMSVNFLTPRQNTTHPHPRISSLREDGQCRDPLAPSPRNHLPLGTTVQEQNPLEQQDDVSVKVSDVNMENNIMPRSLNEKDPEIEDTHVVRNLQASDINMENNIMPGSLNEKNPDTEDIPVVHHFQASDVNMENDAMPRSLNEKHPDIQDIHVVHHQSGARVIYEYQFFPEKPNAKFEMPEDILHSHTDPSVFNSNNIILPFAQGNFYENRGVTSEYAIPVQMPIFAVPSQQGYDTTLQPYSTNYATGAHFPTFPNNEIDDISPPSDETSADDAYTILERGFKREEYFLVAEADDMMWKESEGEDKMIKMLEEMEEKNGVQYLFPVILSPGVATSSETSKQMDPAEIVKGELQFECLLASKDYNGSEYSTSSRGDTSSAEKDRAARIDANNGHISSGSLGNNSPLEVEERGCRRQETSNAEASDESKAMDAIAAVECKQEGAERRQDEN